MADSYSIDKKDRRWAVTREGAPKPASTHSTQTDAWAEARRLARGAGGEAILRNSNGQIQARNSYGKEPFPPKR